MGSRPIPPRSWLATGGASALPGPVPRAPARAGPTNPWRSLLSRRGFLRAAAGTGLVLGSVLALPRRAFAGLADDLTPNPIPIPFVRFGSTFHFVLPGPADQGHEPSLITDFNGFIGVAQGGGKATDSSGNTFATDMRFMKGVYIDVDGNNQQGAFAFI